MVKSWRCLCGLCASTLAGFVVEPDCSVQFVSYWPLAFGDSRVDGVVDGFIVAQVHFARLCVRRHINMIGERRLTPH